MTAADKKKLDGIAAGATNVAVDSALSATSTNPVQNKAVKAALDSKSASGHTHAMITNSALLVSGASNAAQWVKLGTLVSFGNFRSAVIRVWTGDGANARTDQNASFEIQIKTDGRLPCQQMKRVALQYIVSTANKVKVKVIPTAHDTYTIWYICHGRTGTETLRYVDYISLGKHKSQSKTQNQTEQVPAQHIMTTHLVAAQ